MSGRIEGEPRSRNAIVLTGGGARGAYEVGVVQGIVDTLGTSLGCAPFSIFSGTSVGAVNVAWLGAHADRCDLGIEGLRKHWESLNLDDHVRFNPDAFNLVTGGRNVEDEAGHGSSSLLDPTFLEKLVEDELPWDRLRDNVDSGELEMLVVAALEVATGRTIVFTERAEGIELERAHDPGREFVDVSLRADHVLASAAIPLVFPARVIDGELYTDGGLRFNTPITPVIFGGAERMVVISAGRHEFVFEEDVQEARRELYGNPLYLAGKALHELLFRTMRQEVDETRRVNELLDILQDTVSDSQFDEIQRKIAEYRGTPYRKIEVLDFEPSVDPAQIARERLDKIEAPNLASQILVSSTKRFESIDPELLSFILFEKGFIHEMIELGRRDANERADAVREFFDPG